MDWFHSMDEALRANNYSSYDLSILDISLPDGSGLEFCQHLRKLQYTKPIIMLTAQLDEETVVESLNSGANDYIKKPFSFNELFARIRVALRPPYRNEELLEFNGLVLNLKKRTVFYNQ